MRLLFFILKKDLSNEEHKMRAPTKQATSTKQQATSNKQLSALGTPAPLAVQEGEGGSVMTRKKEEEESLGKIPYERI